MSEPINDLPAGLYVLRRMKVTRGSALEMKNPFAVLRALPNVKSETEWGFTLDVLERRGSYEEPGKTE